MAIDQLIVLFKMSLEFQGDFIEMENGKRFLLCSKNSDAIIENVFHPNQSQMALNTHYSQNVHQLYYFTKGQH